MAWIVVACTCSQRKPNDLENNLFRYCSLQIEQTFHYYCIPFAYMFFGMASQCNNLNVPILYQKCKLDPNYTKYAKENRGGAQLANPPGFTTAALSVSDGGSRETDKHLMAKRAWDIAFGPLKQVPMNLFIMYMAGNSISIFPIMMVCMMLIRPVKALLSVNAVFKSVEKSDDGYMLGEKFVFVLGNIIGIFFALYKCSSMGLLPTHKSDWLAFANMPERMEYAVGAAVLIITCKLERVNSSQTKSCWDFEGNQCGSIGFQSVFFSSFAHRMAFCIFCISVQHIVQSCRCGISKEVGSLSVNDAAGNDTFGGSETKANLFPWQVYLTVKEGTTEWKCGGVLIPTKHTKGTNLVLTASECLLYFTSIVKPSSVKVFVGTNELGSGNSVSVEKIMALKNQEIMGFDNIALLKLTQMVDYSDKVQAICLPEQDKETPYGKECYVSGWGLRPHLKKPLTNKLHHARIPVNYAYCAIYRDEYYVFCAGYDQGAKDILMEDLGGPLMCKEGEKFILHGLFVFKPAKQKPSHYSAYTKVSSYIKWMRSALSGEAYEAKNLSKM
ncbi:ER membrane protein complex subunit 4 [Trichinella sp. T6]|nr:ER membrane protein complex subunit 4 [Trichinella sp. T6]